MCIRDSAYKAVPGAADLTDIDPNYMRKILNEVFGLCGIGWGYKYDSADMHTEIEERKRSNGQGTRRVYVATLRRLTFWYKLSAADDSLVTVSYTHLRAHETVLDLVCRLLLEKKHKKTN